MGVEGGYDISIGTSERGVDVESILGGLPKFQSVVEIQVRKDEADGFGLFLIDTFY